MQRGAEVKVGLIVLLAALLLGYFVFVIRGVSAAKTYPIYVTFADARGLQRGDPVEMAGVRIGEVHSVGLKEEKALIELAIDERFPIFANYQIRVAASGLLQERYVEVLPTTAAARGPRLAPGKTVAGSAAPDLAQLMASGQQVLESVNRTVEALQKVVPGEQTTAQLKRAIANLEKASDYAVGLTATATEMTRAAGPQVQEALARLLRAAANVEDATQTVRSQLAEGDILPNVEEASRRALRFSDTMDELANNLSAFLTDPELQNDLRGAVVDLRAAAADLRATAVDARAIAADLKVVSGKAREAAHAIPEAVEGASSLLQTASDIKERLKPPQIDPSFQMLYAADSGDIFSAARIDLSWTGDRFYRLGVDDIGQGTTAEAQVGDRRGRRVLRYGLYRSQLAVGLDVPVSRTSMLSATLFDPNNLRIDALFGIPVVHDHTDTSLLLGARDIGDAPTFVGGVRFAR
jgi:phospholipid/cholesterol/gamma-HCH transport system substrate-binding protein